MGRDGIVEALLWYNVISLSIWFGGTIYQMLVIVPLWSAAPPESVRAFFAGTGYPRTINNFFGRRTQALRAIPLFLLPIIAWADAALRLWLAIPALCTAVALLMTLAYIYPINDTLIFKAGGDLAPDEVRRLARRWIVADRIRLAIMTVGFLALLYAFGLRY
jgi:hypothetical protein